VKREVPAIFAGQKLFLIGLSNVETAAVEQLLISCGATIHPRIIKSVSTVVCLESEYSNSSKALAKAVEYGIPIVNEKWIIDSLATGKAVVAYQPYLFTADNNGKAKAQTADNNNDSEASKPKKKKSKTEPAAPVAATPPAVQCAPKLVAASWLDVAPSTWIGNCSYKKANNHYPFHLLVLACSPGGQITGEVHWPTINNSKTKFRGTLSANGSTFDFEEYEVIGGSDDVEVPVKYSAQLIGKQLVGKVLISDLDDDVTFTADMVSVPLEVLVRSGSKYAGVAFSPLPFRLVIDAVKGEAATGRIEYSSLAVVTSWSGKVTDSGKHLELTEDKLVSGEQGLVPLPSNYKLKLDSGSAGSWKGSFSSSQSMLDGSVDIF